MKQGNSIVRVRWREVGGGTDIIDDKKWDNEDNNTKDNTELRAERARDRLDLDMPVIHVHLPIGVRRG